MCDVNIDCCAGRSTEEIKDTGSGSVDNNRFENSGSNPPNQFSGGNVKLIRNEFWEKCHRYLASPIDRGVPNFESKH